MFKNLQFQIGSTFLLKSLLLAYMLTALLLLLLAGLLYRFGLSNSIVSIGIIIIYVLVSFLSGFVTGKKKGQRKFLWGLLSGGLYFSVLLLISLFVNQGFTPFSSELLTVLLLCAGGGMLGGMLS